MNREPLTNADGEVRELIAADFARAKPASEVFPELVEMQRKARGRPKVEVRKIPTTIRLSPEVAAYFRSTGRGWQTKLNAVLQAYVQSQRTGA